MVRVQMVSRIEEEREGAEARPRWASALVGPARPDGPTEEGKGWRQARLGGWATRPKERGGRGKNPFAFLFSEVIFQNHFQIQF